MSANASPKAMAAFLKSRPASGIRVQLVAELPPPSGGLHPLGEWSREEIVAADEAERDITAEIYAAAQEHTDFERLGHKYMARWMGTHDRPLSSRALRCEVSEEVAAAKKAPIAQDEIVRELLAANITLQKQLTHQTQVITGSYERALKLLSDQLEAALGRAPATDSLAGVELTPEEREEAMQRAQVMKAAASKIPEIIDLAIAAGARHFLPDTSGQQ